MANHEYVYIIENIGNLEKNDVGYIVEIDNNRRAYKIHFLINQEEKWIDFDLCIRFFIEETGDLHSHKICNRCYKHLNTSSHFEDNRVKSGGLITKRPSCRSCRDIKNGVNISASERRIWNARRPENNSIYECPICRKRLIVGVSKIVLDHNHRDGSVRGWVCESCNTGIGRFDDDPEIIYQAIDWLRR